MTKNKKNIERRIQNLVKHLRWNFLRNWLKIRKKPKSSYEMLVADSVR